jgi:hypothetical protein
VSALPSLSLLFNYLLRSLFPQVHLFSGAVGGTADDDRGGRALGHRVRTSATCGLVIAHERPAHSHSLEQRSQRSLTGNLHESAASCLSCGARVRLWPWTISLPITRNLVRHERSQCSLPPVTTVLPATGRVSLFRSLFAVLSAADAARCRGRESTKCLSPCIPVRRINWQATLVSCGVIVRVDGMT